MCQSKDMKPGPARKDPKFLPAVTSPTLTHATPLSHHFPFLQVSGELGFTLNLDFERKRQSFSITKELERKQAQTCQVMQCGWFEILGFRIMQVTCRASISGWGEANPYSKNASFSKILQIRFVRISHVGWLSDAISMFDCFLGSGWFKSTQGILHPHQWGHPVLSPDTCYCTSSCLGGGGGGHWDTCTCLPQSENPLCVFPVGLAGGIGTAKKQL